MFLLRGMFVNKVIKLIFLTGFLFVFSYAAADEKINKIVVHGNQRIQTSTIQEYLRSEERRVGKECRL